MLRTLPPCSQGALVRPKNAERVRNRAERGWAFLHGFAGASADYVNFHWYRPSRSALKEAVRYLVAETGLRPMTNEIGQFTKDPVVTERLMEATLAVDFAHVIWYSIDDVTRAGLRSWALQRPDGTLRRSGRRFRSITSELP